MPAKQPPLRRSELKRWNPCRSSCLAPSEAAADVPTVSKLCVGSRFAPQRRSPEMTEEGIAIRDQSHLKERAFDEFKRFIVIFLYLWVVFGLLSLHKSIVLVQRHLDYPEHVFAIINAFIFAKVLLIGEHFHLGTRFKDKPLIYPILHKCFVFTALLICFHIIESVL